MADGTGVWQYWADKGMGSRGQGWSLYGEDIARRLENAQTCKVQSGGGTYMVQIQKSTQIKMNTHFERNVRRVLWEWKNSNDVLEGYSYADAMKLEEGLKALPSDSDSAIDKAALAHLRDMGFSESDCKKALLAKKNNIEQAAHALLNGDIQPGGDGVLAEVNVKGPANAPRKVVFCADGTIIQQGPLARRDVKEPDATSGWQVYTDTGWVSYDAQECADLDKAYQQILRSRSVQLSGHSVDLEKMCRLEDGGAAGAQVFRWVLPADLKSYISKRRCSRGSSSGTAGEGLWFWQEDDGSWVPYTMAISAMLDDACHVEVGGNGAYAVDLQVMRQCNVNTYFGRNVRYVYWERELSDGKWSRYSWDQAQKLETAFLSGRRKTLVVGSCKVSVREGKFKLACGGGCARNHAPEGAVWRNDGQVIGQAGSWCYATPPPGSARVAFDAAEASALEEAWCSLFAVDFAGGPHVADVMRFQLKESRHDNVIGRLRRVVVPVETQERVDALGTRTPIDVDAAGTPGYDPPSYGDATALPSASTLPGATAQDAIAAAEAKAEAKAAEEFRKREEELNAQIQKLKDADAQKQQALQQQIAEMQKLSLQFEQMQEQRKRHDEQLMQQGRKARCIPWDELEVTHDQTGLGSFKSVFKGFWKGQAPDGGKKLVALLVVRNGEDISHEVKVLELLGRHAGITPLYAVTEDPRTSPPNKCMVMEFAHHGSLDSVLAKSHESVAPPTDGVLLKMAVQVADAMQHLALHDLVHGDLATRNVLVYQYSQQNTKDIEVKISDFGLASRVAQAGGAAGPDGASAVSGVRPVRWMAPEALSTEGLFSEKTDVWAFGVLIWELFALPKGAPNGGRPYNDIDDDNEVSRRVVDGSLQLACDGPPPAAAVMSATLARDAAQRPKFKALVVDLNEAMHEVRKAQDLMLDEDEHNCCVCFDVKRSVLIQPCGHLCLCQDCSHTVTVTNECPLCRGPIASLVTVYQ